MLTAGQICKRKIVTPGSMRAAGVRHIPVVDERGIMKGVVAFDDIVDLLRAQAPESVALLALHPTRERRERALGVPACVKQSNEPERG